MDLFPIRVPVAFLAITFVVVDTFPDIVLVVFLHLTRRVLPPLVRGISVHFTS